MPEWAGVMCDVSVAFAFGDFRQCAAMQEAADAMAMRTPPCPWIWDKSNERASSDQQLCNPGATYVKCMLVCMRSIDRSVMP